LITSCTVYLQEVRLYGR